jgi:glutaredoxin|tara:strand:+ start:1582 stop:1818 length:237 start_codon:yes stop_codon:yes gene_type:complete
MSFIVYSKDGCPYCTKVINVLKLAELKHVVYKLGKDFSKTDFYEEFGEGSTFPRVRLDDEVIGGCSETVKFLKENKLV